MVRQVTRPAEPSAGERREIKGYETLRIRRSLEELCEARCPLCRMVLVARYGRAGPGFFCRCPRRRAA